MRSRASGTSYEGRSKWRLAAWSLFLLSAGMLGLSCLWTGRIRDRFFGDPSSLVVPSAFNLPSVPLPPGWMAIDYRGWTVRLPWEHATADQMLDVSQVASIETDARILRLDRSEDPATRLLGCNERPEICRYLTGSADPAEIQLLSRIYRTSPGQIPLVLGPRGMARFSLLLRAKRTLLDATQLHGILHWTTDALQGFQVGMPPLDRSAILWVYDANGKFQLWVQVSSRSHARPIEQWELNRILRGLVPPLRSS